MKFEWDLGKEQINLRKHGLDFEIACHVFLDEHRVEYYDEAHSTADETRYITIGSVGEIIMVVYTERGNALRIISARPATKMERERYYYGN